MDVGAFAKTLLQYAFDGEDITGADIQQLGIKHGLLVEVPYGPDKHGEHEFAEHGDLWHVYSPEFEAFLRK